MWKSDEVTSGPSSIITTESPALARISAAVPPPAPVPTIATSASTVRSSVSVEASMTFQPLASPVRNGSGRCRLPQISVAISRPRARAVPGSRSHPTRADCRTRRRARSDEALRTPSAAARSGCRASVRGMQPPTRAMRRARATTRLRRCIASARRRAARRADRAPDAPTGGNPAMASPAPASASSRAAAASGPLGSAPSRMHRDDRGEDRPRVGVERCIACCGPRRSGHSRVQPARQEERGPPATPALSSVRRVMRSDVGGGLAKVRVESAQISTSRGL